MPELEEVARAVYAVSPGEFTAARTAAVRDARAAGDRELARAVGALRKPSSAAAAVNLLVRDRPEDLGALLDLGVRLREAQAALAGADLRALHAEQQRTVGAVADAAVDLLGGGAGGGVRQQVEATLRAAMGDPDAAAAVATGLLVRDLFSSGFEPVDVAGAVALPDAGPIAGAPARRTPLRAVQEPAAEAPDEAEHRAPRRRRGRLLTADDPEPAPADAPAGRRRGRLVTAPEEADARADAEAGHGSTGAAGGTERARRGKPARAERGGAAATGRAERGRAAGSAGAERERQAEAERERQAEAERAERERKAEAERAERERRRAAAVRAAEQDLALARDEARERVAARDAADARLRDAEDRAAELAATTERAREEIERLRAALADAEQEAREVGLEVRHARSSRTAAARQAERAESRLRAAEAARDALGPAPAGGGRGARDAR